MCNPTWPPGIVDKEVHRQSDSRASVPGIDRMVGDALTDKAEPTGVRTSSTEIVARGVGEHQHIFQTDSYLTRTSV